MTASSDYVVHARFSAKIQLHNFQFEFCMPLRALEVLESVAGISPTPNSASATSVNRSSEFGMALPSGQLQDAPVHIEAVLGDMDLTVAQLMSLTDYFRMMLDGSVTLGQLEAIMHQEIEVLHEEMHQPSHSMMTLSDSLPAFGIVAAIVGVIRALTSIATSSPGQIGEMIAAALLGTLFGVFAAYAILGPIGRTLQQVADIELRPFQAVKEILIAHYSDFSPIIAVEYGRKVLYSDQRPSMLELESGVRDASRSAPK